MRRSNMHRAVGYGVDRGVEASLAALDASFKQDPVCVYAALLRQCADARSYLDGKKIHRHIDKHGFQGNAVLANCLVQMYGRCGCLEDARSVFESSPKNELSWSAIIGAYAKNGRKREALDLFQLWRSDGGSDRGGATMFMNALSACSGAEDLSEGRAIHAAIVAAGMGDHSDTMLDTAIFSMYARCGSLDEAWAVFDAMPGKDVVCYTIMISAYAQKRHYWSAIELYEDMGVRGIEPNDKTFACVLSACSGLKDLDRGRRVHRRIRDTSTRVDTVLENALLNMYARCGDLQEARQIFQRMDRKTVASWNTMIKALVQHELFADAIDVFRRMDATPNTITFTAVLGACCSPEDLHTGKSIHRQILASAQTDDILQNSLVTMYGKCGSLEDAERVFHGIRRKNAFSWTSMITAYAKHGLQRKAIEVFEEMVSEGKVAPDPITYAGVLTACSTIGDLDTGIRVHDLVRSRDVDSNMVSTALIDLYGKWGSLEDALQVFESVRDGDVITWTAVIGACLYHAQPEKALEMFWRMEQQGVEANNITFSRVLASCCNLEAYETGKAVESRIKSLGLDCDEVLQDGILSLHAKCGSLAGAREIFNAMPHKSVVSWTAMISAYNQRGYQREALELFQAMNVEPDDIAFSNALQACAKLQDLEQGRAIHARISSREVEPSSMLQTLLTHMYVRCGDLTETKRTFDGFQTRDVISWTSLISAFVQKNLVGEALELFHRMDLEGVRPNSVTFCAVIDACTRMSSVSYGRTIHFRVAAMGLASDQFVANALVGMYSKFGRVDLARKVFDSISVKRYPSWRVMMVALMQNGYSREALEIYSRVHLEGLRPGSPIFSAAVISCTALEDLKQARAIHEVIKTSDFQPDIVLQNVLMNMYAKSGEVDEARRIFDQMLERSEVSWTTMIGAYSQNGRPREALELYEKMDVEPNYIAFVPVITSCAELGALAEGQRVHARISDAGLATNDFIVTALVDMYAKCGKLDFARQFFDTTLTFDVGAWNCMATSYAQSGHGSQVLDLYREMCLQGVKANEITLLSVLVSCSHMGMLEECQQQFESMISDHGIAPASEHYSCMTDLLARSGKLEEAEMVVQTMGDGSCESPKVSAWMSLLGACKTHSDWDRAAGAAERLYKLDPDDSAPYILLSNAFAPDDARK